MGKKHPLEPLPSPSSSKKEENHSSEEEEGDVKYRIKEDKVDKTNDETKEEESNSDSNSDSNRPSPSPSTSKLKPVSPPPPAKIPGSSSVSHQSAIAKKKGGSRSVEKAKTVEKSMASMEGKVARKFNVSEEGKGNVLEVGKGAKNAGNAKKKGGSSSVKKAKGAHKGKAKGKAFEKGKVVEKGKASEEGKASEKVEAAEEHKVVEQGMALEEAKAAEVGQAAENTANAKKKGGSSSMEKAKASQKGKEKGKAAKEGKTSDEGDVAEEGRASEQGKVAEGMVAKKGKAAEEGKVVAKGKALEKGKARAAATSLFQQVWSEEDELALLRGMIEYKAQKGTKPYVYLGYFYEFVRKAFHFYASRNQLVAKMKRLKGRYRRNAANSKCPVSSNPYDVKLFELSKNIWEVNPRSMRPLKKAKSERVKIQDNDNAVEDMLKEYPLLNASLNEMKPELRFGKSVLLRDEFVLTGKSLMDEMEMEWKKLKEDEVRLLTRKNALIAKQMGLVLDAIKY